MGTVSKHFLAALVVTALLPAATKELKAEIRLVHQPSGGDLSIYITQTIKSADADKLSESENELKTSFAQVYLNSTGGDVNAAMRIGRLIRKYDGWTVIGAAADLPIDSKCYSSCALIYIAGVYRSNFGELGLHRPYLAAEPQRREVVESEVTKMLQSVKDCVAEMGITPNFYEQMVNTEPSQMVIYRGDDTKKLIPEYDPIYAEVEIARDARRYGITTLEMRQRIEESKSCDKLPGMSRINCTEAINWGLSTSVYRERNSKASTACSYTPDEIAALGRQPFKSRPDQPAFINREICVRNVMLGR